MRPDSEKQGRNQGRRNEVSFLGFDTSNYTTSIAIRDGETIVNMGRLLPVAEGELGLRQSDALFQHIKQLPELSRALWTSGSYSRISAVGASTRPRTQEGSYMPCFRAGETCGRLIADAFGIPFYEFSHQDGHIAAAAWSGGHAELLERELLAWHISGGTTELVHVVPDRNGFKVEIIGGTTDISAGQLIDRTGKLLGIRFPAGKELDILSQESNTRDSYPIKLKDFSFSLSGMQNKAENYFRTTGSRSDTARYVINIISDAIVRTTEKARQVYPGLPVLLSGGVTANTVLRRRLSMCEGVYMASGRYAGDNAAGIAFLTAKKFLESGGIGQK